MKMLLLCCLHTLLLVHGTTCQKVDPAPLLDSFIPASMQIIAHITELMKYDLKPPTNPTTTPQSPTPTHKPAIFAPDSITTPVPKSAYEEYLEKLQNPSGTSYFDRYGARSLLDPEVYGQVPLELELMVGRGPSDLIRLTNTIERDQNLDDDARVQEFSKIYDDSDFRMVLLKQQKKPPTRAYVGLLSLYDLLNKESKKLGLNKYGGYSNNILAQLAETSSGTSTDQLRIVLKQIADRKDTKNATILKRIAEMLKDLDESTSYISTALRYIPPLNFAL